MRAPIAGTVVQKLVLPGQFIQAGATAAFVISNVSTVWVQGHVYEKDLRVVHVGDTVEMRNASFPHGLPRRRRLHRRHDRPGDAHDARPHRHAEHRRAC